jgi:tRNA A-37 threonylcarbamoyl transferase component Bud32
MSQRELVFRSNGNVRPLGWCRFVSRFEPTSTVKMFSDAAFFGKVVDCEYFEGFQFTEFNTPQEILRLISRAQFTITRKPSTEVNLKPAVIHVQGQNGLFLNDVFLAQGQKRILKNFDEIKVNQEIALFKFIDDRIFNTNGIPSTALSKYHFDSFIGRGAQSTVRKIHEYATGEKFAMKIIPKVRYEDEATQRYWKRRQHMDDEVNNMRQLRHINIIRFVEWFENERSRFIVMEFGFSDLCVHLMKFPGHFLPEAEAKFCCFQITQGVAYIHDRNIAHRDIKVENVFILFKQVNGKSEIIYKIGDFGFSKSADKRLSTQLGTPCYLPPEILNIWGDYEISADIWTLGCLFYAVLSGTFPFGPSHPMPIERQITEGFLSWSSPNWNFVSLKTIQALG